MANTSFNFDSSPSDDEDIDLDDFDDTGLLALSSRQQAIATSPPASCNESHIDDGSNIDWEDGESDIDWQDADDPTTNSNDHSSEEDMDKKMPALPRQGVTVTFSAVNSSADELLHDDAKKLPVKPDQEEKVSKKRKRIHVLKDVPYHMQQLILNVRRSHLLCCVARSVQCSSLCSTVGLTQNHTAFSDNWDEEEEESREMLLNLANSLIPLQYHPTETDSDDEHHTVPTNRQLYEFTQWFLELVDASKRRRDTIEQNVARGAAGSPAVRKRARRSAAAGRQSSSKRLHKSAIEDVVPEGIGCDEFVCIDAKTDEIPSTNSLITRLTYLSPYYDDDPQLFINDGLDVIALVDNITPLDTVLLYLIMVRSLGWRARFVSALDPLPFQLTVDHPLLNNINVTPKQSHSSASFAQSVSILQNTIRLMREGGVLKISDKKGKMPSNSANQRNHEKNGRESTISVSNEQSEHDQHILSWVEVLCSDSESSPKHIKSTMLKQSHDKQQEQTAKWVAIFPNEISYDNPLDAEVILAQVEDNTNKTRPTQTGNRQSSKRGNKQLSRKVVKRKPVAYVLAVEHFQSPSAKTSVRLTDVTPRYASVWSQTLRLRGATGKGLSQNEGKCIDEWWTESLKVINRQYRNKSDKSGEDKKPVVKSSTRVSVTKSMTSAGKEVEVLEIASSSDEEILNGDHLDESDHETKELVSASMSKEPMPKSKAAFKQHPQYVIASVLNSTEVLHPDARKHICGVFKGEMVYRRKDVSKALRAKKWLYQGRQVKEKEISNPVKKVKARQKRSKGGFQALDSYVDSNEEALPTSYTEDEDTEMDSLYGIWQTKPWSPPAVGPHDVIPVNEYRNVELAMINPGLTHMEQPRLSLVARKLGIPYAPCMVGYEGHRGNQTPTVRGIVVHNHNVELLNEAYLEYQSQLVESEVETRREEILKKWNRLIVGILTKDRLDKAYG